jgi:hypothetical protein
MRQADGGPCDRAYVIPAEPAVESKPGVFVPSGPIQAVVEQGEEKLGTLWCKADATRLIGTRLISRMVALTVTRRGSDAEADDVARYVSEATAPGGWALWCEPPGERTNGRAGGGHLKKMSIDATVVLPSDWQPIDGWTWHIPAESALSTLSVSLASLGHWGTLSCTADLGDERSISVHKVKVIGRAGVALDGISDNGISWKRYPDSVIFPHWAWTCGAANAKTPTELRGSLDDGTSGKIVTQPAWQFIPEGAAACLIDAVSGLRAPGKPPAKGGRSAREMLEKFPVAGCDNERSKLFFKDASP